MWGYIYKNGIFLTNNIQMPQTSLKEYDLTDEQYREYDFGGRIYRIDNPVALYYSSGATTHRVLDREGVIHCPPTVGKDGCVLRWKPREGTNPVAF